MARSFNAINTLILIGCVIIFWGCSIDIDRSETNSEDGKNNSENLLPDTQNKSDEEYIDDTYLELSIENETELSVGQEAEDYEDYKMSIRLYDIRCLQNYPSYKKQYPGWSPQEECMVFAKTVILTADASLKVKDAPYGVYFLDVRITDPTNRLVAHGSDEVVIVRDALNESRIMVKSELYTVDNPQPVAVEQEGSSTKEQTTAE